MGQSGAGNALYRDGTEAVTELVGVFINELEMVRDVRLTVSRRRARARTSRSRRSTGARKHRRSLAGNLSGMRRSVPGLAASATRCRPTRAGWRIDPFQLVNGVAAARPSDGPDRQRRLPTRKLRGKLAYFALVTSSLSTLIGTRLTAEFGLTAGFSSLDGD